MSKNRVLPPLRLESYQNECKPRAQYLLSCSDASPMTMAEVLNMADPECKAMWDNLDLSYGRPWGHSVLRKEVAKVHKMAPENVLVNVPQGAIYMAVNVLVPYLTKRSGLPRIHVVTCRPTYGVLAENPRHLDCDLDYWQASYTDKGWKFDLNDLEAAVKDHTRLLIINFPHNPTGCTISEETYRQLIEFCKTKGIFLFSDEMYMFTNNDGAPTLPSACTLYQDAITLFGMSKTLAQPGLGIGWLVSHNEGVLNQIMAYKDYLNNCSSAPAEILSIITLRNLDRVLKRNMDIIQSNLKLADGFFADYKDIFEWHRPPASTVAMVKVKGWLMSLGQGQASGFCECLLNRSGVMLAPSRLFDVQDDFVRIGFGRTDFKDALKQLRDFLEKNKP